MRKIVFIIAVLLFLVSCADNSESSLPAPSGSSSSSPQGIEYDINKFKLTNFSALNYVKSHYKSGRCLQEDENWIYYFKKSKFESEYAAIAIGGSLYKKSKTTGEEIYIAEANWNSLYLENGILYFFSEQTEMIIYNYNTKTNILEKIILHSSSNIDLSRYEFLNFHANYCYNGYYVSGLNRVNQKNETILFDHTGAAVGILPDYNYFGAMDDKLLGFKNDKIIAYALTTKEEKLVMELKNIKWVCLIDGRDPLLRCTASNGEVFVDFKTGKILCKTDILNGSVIKYSDEHILMTDNASNKILKYASNKILKYNFKTKEETVLFQTDGFITGEFIKDNKIIFGVRELGTGEFNTKIIDLQ